MTNCQFIAVLLIIQCFALATLAENSTVNISPSIVAAADSSSFGELPTGNYYPFQVQLRLPNETPYCGGYVITTFLVLTAAHCVHKDQINSVEVVGGHYNGSINHEQIGKIQEVFIHDEYNATERRNDIALVVLQTELIYNSFVSPAKIPYNVTRTVNDSQPSDGFLWDATKYFDWIQDKYLLSTLIFGCPGGFFRCLNDQCVDPRGLCDGSEDCGDTSDEDRDTCDVFGSYKPTFRLQAPATMYQCYYRYFEENRSQQRLYKYISRDMVCDGNVDCSHRSEERRCNNCSSDAYHCQESSECIPRDDRCDGNPNCEKGVKSAFLGIWFATSEMTVEIIRMKKVVLISDAVEGE
ncbi:unnamed protein product [Allacma fusca]|uniref:Peptidase S1 domain-containing protein n=1 Tax=Allacma fusca TaxID=39272 RepID=A0A8J2JRL2_9HEXA|nr:unnamed protein product [Allacma fusca]